MVTNKNVAEKVATKSTQNGNDSKLSAVKLPVIVSENEPAQKSELSSIEARLKKLERLQQLAERRELLLEAIENLHDFYISPDAKSCNLRLQDSKGKTFSIAHPIVIGEMVSMAKGKLTAELEKIGGQIDFSIS